MKQELAAESDEQKKDALTAELKEKETKLDTLMAAFEVRFPDPRNKLHHSPQDDRHPSWPSSASHLCP